MRFDISVVVYREAEAIVADLLEFLPILTEKTREARCVSAK